MSCHDQQQLAREMIVNVWEDNLEVEIASIRDMARNYHYIAMDTEFPGIVARPIGSFKNNAECQYQTLRCNVDLLHLIQLGLTLSDRDGNFPPGPCTWQFHFRFSVNKDMYSKDSIDLLVKSGIDFKKHELHGISVKEFGSLLTTSGLVLCPEVRWISFHGGYDFGYLLKTLTSILLPPSESEFFEFLRIYFPIIYDIKYLIKSCKNLKGGLQDIADNLDVKRIGPKHQAGSDSLLTLNVFFRLKNLYFDNVIDDSKYSGRLYGFNSHVR